MIFGKFFFYKKYCNEDRERLYNNHTHIQGAVALTVSKHAVASLQFTTLFNTPSRLR